MAAEMSRIVDCGPHSGQFHSMFMISESEARQVREAYLAGGDEAASCALRGLFAGLEDNEATRDSAVRIARWAGIDLVQAVKVSRVGKTARPR